MISKWIEWSSKCRRLRKTVLLTSDIGTTLLFCVIVTIFSVDAIGVKCDTFSIPVLLLFNVFATIANLVFSCIYVFNCFKVRESIGASVFFLTLGIIYGIVYFVMTVVAVIGENVCIQVGDEVWICLLVSIGWNCILFVRIIVIGCLYF